MAEEGADLYGEIVSCSICLNLLKEPVTIPCGHSYCKTCISSFWDGEAVKNSYSCPQCREVFIPRPVLVKNIMMAEVVEKLDKSRLHNDPAVENYATAEDVCLTSYWKKHLQPHHESAAFKRHKLVNPSKKLQENICSRHNEAIKIFCRTDQQCICILCSMDEHKDHNIISVAAERTEKKRELQESRADVQKNIQDREKDVDLLKHQVKTINISADQTEEHSEKMFTEMISLLQNRRSELKKLVRSKQQTEVSAAQELQEKLEQEIIDLKKRDAELQQISTTEDHIQFVLSYSSLSALSVSTHSSIILTRPGNCFEEVTAAVSEFRKHLDKVLMEDWTKVCQTVERTEPVSRAGFLKYSQEITLDSNTAGIKLSLSEGKRKVTRIRGNQGHPPHPDRFTVLYQVLSRESVTGRCYWEVEWRGNEVCVAVTYKSISRAGSGKACGLGLNNKSWSLTCTPTKYTFNHNNISTTVLGPHSSRIGVYVDHTAGILSFYKVCDTMTLLHRVNTTFTEPLHLGFWLNKGDTAELCKL